jgi:integrase
MTFRKAKITTKLVEGLKPGETVADAALQGFMVRRQQSDAQVYFVRKAFRGTRHYVTIGEHGANGWTEAKARQEAQLIIAGVLKGGNPTSERSRAKAMPTLSEWLDTFLANQRGILKPATLSNYESFARNYIAPRDEAGHLKPGCLGRLKLDHITRAEVASLHRKLAQTPRNANHLVSFLSVVFSEAQAAGYLPEAWANPARNIKRYSERKRERFLNEAELDRLGDALRVAEIEQDEDPYAIAAIRLLMVTGCRRDEILSARWEWIDFQRGLLNLPDSKTGSKSVHLSPAALEILSSIPRVEGNPFVIVGRKQGQRFVGLRRVWVRIRTAAKLAPTTLPNGKVEHVRLHDLRHSFASLSAAGGASLLMIGKLLGHASPATTARYAHLVDDPLKRVSDNVGKRLSAALKPAEPHATAEIVSLPVRS